MKRVTRVVLPVVLAVIIVFLVVVYVMFYHLTHGPLPEHDGELIIPGLNDRVEIVRDEWGIPHIYASNMQDLFFVQGYTQAQDRWWQMELFRHAGSGTVEELTGKNHQSLATDILTRTLSLRRVAEQEVSNCDGETMAILQAFADGVNAYITSRDSSDLALEYGILNLIGIDIKIKPWTPADTLVFSKLIAWDMGPRFRTEEIRSKLYELIGQEMTDQWLTPSWPYTESPTIIKPEELSSREPVRSTKAGNAPRPSDTDVLTTEITLPDMGLGFGYGQGIGSNNWVVGGSMTESGKPLLANDPHLGIQMPSIWYEIGLHCHPSSEESSFDVVGFAFPVAPGIVIGHNHSIAWGITNTNPDVFDLYRIRVNPDNELQYEWNGEWRNMTVRNETIYFGDGEEPITIQVRETHLGPIITDNQIDEETGESMGFNNENPLALRWTALDPGTVSKAILELNKATNWPEFHSALEYWDVPSQNVVYADVEGNIGYQMPGRIPIRNINHSGLLPVPGWTDEFEWQGFIPYDSLPRLFNPTRGYIATANQAVVPLEYYNQLAQELGEAKNYIISREWNYVYRAERITEMLEDGAPHSIFTFQAIQGDNKLINAEELVPYLADLRFDDVELVEARDWLLEWDYQCDMESPHAALYAQFWARLVDNLYTDQVGEDIPVYGIAREMLATSLLVQEPNSPWWDDITTEDITETRDDILVRSFREGYVATVTMLGKNRDNWRWGDLHTATFVSTPLGLSGIGLVENIVNRGPVAVSGSTETINNTVWVVPLHNFSVAWLTSMRMIIDLSDFTQSIAVHTTGQSGHPYSEHYDDMIEPWRKVEYHTMLWTRAQVEGAASNRLILSPGD